MEPGPKTSPSHPTSISDEALLAALLDLNLVRAGAGAGVAAEPVADDDPE